MKPILLIVFNRPDETERLISCLKAVRPAKIHVAADGPRVGNAKDQENCARVRALFDRLPWECEVVRNFSEENQGCKLGVSTAITWFFSLNDDGIILEDDCLPVRDFFSFCGAMLDRYKDEARVGHIGGFNCQDDRRRGDRSYYFSQYFHVWGWATWARAWKDFDLEMKDYPVFQKEKVLDSLFGEPSIEEFWEANFKQAYLNQIDTWDYQWVFANLKLDRLSIIPNTNLVVNIGFGENATHTTDSDNATARIRAGSLQVDEGPRFMVKFSEADRFTYSHHLGLRLNHDTMKTWERKGRDQLLAKLAAPGKRIFTLFKHALLGRPAGSD